jgi:glycosyltransferase involved in cell wall biosynthesis
VKILHINTNDASGGAAKAANRLHNGLRKAGINSWMLVQRKQSDDKFIIGAKNNLFYRGINYLRGKIDYLPFRILYPNREKTPLSLNWIPNPFLIRKIKKIDPDIIHLHWINGGFVSVKDLGKMAKLGKPIVWTLHDSWCFTGGCHIPYECEKYKYKCKKCPKLNSESKLDLIERNFQRKSQIFKEVNFSVTCPSNWLADCAKKSLLLKNKDVQVIPNPIDLNIFKPYPKKKTREKNNLPQDKKLILFGAMNATKDKNKGFEYLCEALKEIDLKNKEVVVFGASDSEEIRRELNFDCYFLGNIKKEEEMVEVYNSADVFLAPSLQDNLPNTLVEAASCGVPCVGFSIGGVPDIIDHKETGYLAEYKNCDDLVNGIQWVLSNKKHQILREKVRRNAKEKFGKDVVVDKYVNLYKSLL